WLHLKPAFGGIPPSLSLGAPYTSNTLLARDCKTPLGYGYSIATLKPSPPHPIWVPRLGFSLCRPALPYHLFDYLYHGRSLHQQKKIAIVRFMSLRRTPETPETNHRN